MMLLFPAGDQSENPWKAKVPAAEQRADRDGSVAAIREAFDVTWRADDWRAGLTLADLAPQKHPDAPTLLAPAVRALWRGGRIADAERLFARLPADTSDLIALRTGIELNLVRSRFTEVEERATRLARLKPESAEDLYAVFAARFALNQLDGLPAILRRAEKLSDSAHGYPEMYVQEAIEGLAEFLDAVGTQPLNQIAAHGAAPMPPLVLLNLPSCEVFINGRGPYRMVVDTGGSLTVALDQEVAHEIGLKSIASSSVRGVSGKQATGQVLIDELQIGTIKCRRVVTRTFDVRGAIMNAAAGIIGTGIFANGRMTLDFVGGQLIIAPSGAQPAAGHETELRLVADSKLIVPVTLEGQPAVAMLDTGADAVALAPTRLTELFPDRPVRKFDTGLALGVGGDQTPSITVGSGVALEFAGRKFENYSGLGLDVLDDVLGPVLGVRIDILIGMPAFREMKSCTVDFPHGRMWVDWLKGE